MESSIFVWDPIKGVFWPFKAEWQIYLTDTVSTDDVYFHNNIPILVCPVCNFQMSLLFLSDLTGEQVLNQWKSKVFLELYIESNVHRLTNELKTKNMKWIIML